MAGFIQNIIWNSVEGFVDAAKKTGGEYAGNALIKAGDVIENSGRSVGGGTYLPSPNSDTNPQDSLIPILALLSQAMY